MVTYLLLAGPVLLTLAGCSESTLALIVKIFELLGLVGLIITKSSASLPLCAWAAPLLLELAHNTLWDGRFLAFAAFHAALWLAKILLLAAIFTGHGE